MAGQEISSAGLENLRPGVNISKVVERILFPSGVDPNSMAILLFWVFETIENKVRKNTSKDGYPYQRRTLSRSKRLFSVRG